MLQIVCMMCIGFAYEPLQETTLGQRHMHHIGIMYTAYAGYILINSVFFVARVIDDRVPYRTTAIFSLLGCVLFLITGILLLMDRGHAVRYHFFPPHTYKLSMLTTSLCFAFVNSAIFAVDSILTFMRQEDF